MTSAQLLAFKEIIKSSPGSDNKKLDKDTKKLLDYLFTSTRGGLTRLKIIIALLDRPCNAHQLSLSLGMDYKAVQHHMNVLGKNNMVTKIGAKYGATFHLSTFLEVNIRSLDEVIDKLDRKLNQKKVYL